MTTETIRKRLMELHQQEDEMNREMENCRKQIIELEKRRQKLAKRISGNMKFRNILINKL